MPRIIAKSAIKKIIEDLDLIMDMNKIKLPEGEYMPKFSYKLARIQNKMYRYKYNNDMDNYMKYVEQFKKHTQKHLDYLMFENNNDGMGLVVVGEGWKNTTIVDGEKETEVVRQFADYMKRKIDYYDGNLKIAKVV